MKVKGKVQVISYITPKLAKALESRRKALGGTVSTSALVSMILAEALK